MLKKLSQKSFLLVLLLGYCFQSHAALLIEPVVGYSFGKRTDEVSGTATPDTTTAKLKGTSYGGRLGYQMLGIQIGVDYLASTMTDGGDKFKTSEFGGFLGYEFPILLRVYAGYIFSGTATLSDKTTSTDIKGGSGPKVGIGFTLLPFLDFNIEYRSVTYSQLKDAVPTVLSGVNLDSKYNAIMVGFSLPFTL